MSWFNKIKNSKFFTHQVSAEPSFLVVGLGNPGGKYVGTRHNFGRDLLLYLKSENELDFSPWQNNSKFEALISEGEFNNVKTILFLPETFMNLSGRAIDKYFSFSKSDPQVIVIHDDVDLPFGSVKISKGKGAGGHNGVSSIMNALGTKDFIRIRLGVGKSDVIPTNKFVLEKFMPEEQANVLSIFNKVISDLKETIKK